MGGYYLIAGRKVANEYLALGVLGSIAAGVSWFRMSSASKNDIKSGPPIVASSSDEESFIREFLAAAEEKKDAEKH
ncbi:hypothetical protein SYNPS1DRAFT_20938 [Syncephalis pseudoplumigaleata]|uniref:ATP synthase subunit K, mitochondrial n=1 Tax=Syncephalis pseudoplumigaleata TaxID=1712513 RepID=A0A4P9Z506_9FUNG|nr:hypothetical protein SYNPS1DRAFT_20938 [Syncephalis pseudoplumigaleata]|eukprot:RKP27565.1 hypothetical protein SYNPS1DRAFT_20938 [Syncephalis pseudoplumigaleata]